MKMPTISHEKLVMGWGVAVLIWGIISLSNRTWLGLFGFVLMVIGVLVVLWSQNQSRKRAARTKNVPSNHEVA